MQNDNILVILKAHRRSFTLDKSWQIRVYLFLDICIILSKYTIGILLFQFICFFREIGQKGMRW